MSNGWVLREALVVTDSEDHPYLETASGFLGRHTISVHLSGDWNPSQGRREFKVFLDGAQIYSHGDVSPAKAWFELCREQGYTPEQHWDLDPALILFKQVIPKLGADWHEIELPYTDAGVPDGVVCLSTIRQALEERNAVFRHHPLNRSQAIAADLVGHLPLRAIVFHDDPERRVDFVGNALDDAYLGVYLHFGYDPLSQVILSRVTLSSTGGMRWSPWLPGGAWSNQGREFAATQSAKEFWRAARMEGQAPDDFEEIFRSVYPEICEYLEPFIEVYRESYPAGIPWHRDPRSRYLNRMIVDVRMDEHSTVLIFDDGSEVVVKERREAPAAVEVWGV
jgi:hypothetical protein